MAVRQARAKGITWDRIGAILDLSPQEAARRHTPRWQRVMAVAQRALLLRWL